MNATPKRADHELFARIVRRNTMKKMLSAPLCAVLIALVGCASTPEGGNADSPAALLGVSLEGNAAALPQERAFEIARAALSQEGGLVLSDSEEVERIVQKATEKSRKKARAKARSDRFDNFFNLALGSKSAIDALADEIAIQTGGKTGITSISDKAEFTQDLHKALAKDSMTRCRSFVYITVSAGVQEKDGFVKPCARTVVRLKDKGNKTIKSVMAVCGAQPVASADARTDRNRVSAAFEALTEQSLRLAAESLYTAGKNNERFTMETESLVTGKPFMMLLSPWK